MRTFSIAILGLAGLLAACGAGGGSSSENAFLGKFPAMEKEYESKIEDMENKLSNAKSMDEMVEFGNKVENLEKEKEEKIDAYVSTNPFSDTLPIKRLNNDPRYSISNVKVKTARTGVLNIEFTIAINEDIPGLLNVYFKAIDTKGEEIPGSRTVAVSFARVALNAGINYTVEGGWRSAVIQNMEDFASIVEITEEEYSNR
jgi:hypothetical protein